jgi:hypothetical protein
MQVIEVFIRSEEGLSRDMVKHLNSIEEQVLECRAWTADSVLWEALEQAHNKVPTVEEVSTQETLQLQCTAHGGSTVHQKTFFFLLLCYRGE